MCGSGQGKGGTGMHHAFAAHHSSHRNEPLEIKGDVVYIDEPSNRQTKRIEARARPRRHRSMPPTHRGFLYSSSILAPAATGTAHTGRGWCLHIQAADCTTIHCQCRISSRVDAQCSKLHTIQQVSRSSSEKQATDKW
jgi:hypothetical protein